MQALLLALGRRWAQCDQDQFRVLHVHSPRSWGFSGASVGQRAPWLSGSMAIWGFWVHLGMGSFGVTGPVLNVLIGGIG